MMSTDTIQEEKEPKPCKAKSFEECEHFDQNERYPVAVHLDGETMYYLQKLADRQYPAQYSKSAHCGNKGNMLRYFIHLGLKKSIPYDSYQHIDSVVGATPPVRNIDEEELESLKEDNRNKQRQIDNLQKKVKDLKYENGIAEGSSDVLIYLFRILDEPLRFEQIMDFLRDKGLDSRKYENPASVFDEGCKEEISLEEVVDYYLREMVELGQLEVKEKNGRTHYQA